jgi:chorismate mutase
MTHTEGQDEHADPVDALGQCRKDIDRVDRVLAALLHERARLALAAGRMKLAAGEPLIAPARETAVLARVRELAGGALEAERLVRIFRTIIDETRGAEHQWLADGEAVIDEERADALG